MAMVVELHKGHLHLHGLDFGTIILLPKSSDAKKNSIVQPNMSFQYEL
jgi:hypothetical protein